MANEDNPGRTKLFLIALSFDFVFLLLYYYFRYSPSLSYFSRISEHVDSIAAVALSSKGIRLSASPSLSSILFNQYTQASFISIAALLLLFMLSVYFAYCFLCGTSTYILFNLDRFSKERLVAYVKSFFIVNMPWFMIMFLASLVSFYRSFIQAYQSHGDAHASVASLATEAVFWLFLGYFMLVSYAFERKGLGLLSSLKAGISNFLKLFPYYLMIVAVAFAFSGAVSLFSSLFYKPGGASGAFILFFVILLNLIAVLASLSWARLAFMRFCRKCL